MYLGLWKACEILPDWLKLKLGSLGSLVPRGGGRGGGGWVVAGLAELAEAAELATPVELAGPTLPTKIATSTKPQGWEILRLGILSWNLR